MAAVSNYSPPDIVSEAMQKYDEAKGHHDLFVRSFDRRERAYRGMLTARSDAAKWRHKLHPPIAFNLIETIVANMIEQGLAFDIRPAPHVNVSLDEAQHMLEQADTVEYLLRHEHRVDEMDDKQRPFFLSGAVGGICIGKEFWNYLEGPVRRQGVQNVDIHDEQGQFLGQVPTITEIEDYGILRDHSTFEVVDPRDFIMHESARSLQPYEHGGAQHVFHRQWYSFEQLKMYEKSGFFKNVDLLKESIDFSDEYTDREQTIWNINRTKDLIEVIEYWCFKNGSVYRSYIANRMVLLRDEERSPFWHNQYPFVIASSMPAMFSPYGMSDVELIEQLQEMLWELSNQRLDNIEIINNAIMLIRSDIDDEQAFEYYPGAHWPVDGRPSDSVTALQPPYQVAEVSIHSEALLRGELQNVTSAAPLAAGAESQTVDNKTATGASIIMQAAQRRLTAKKYQGQLGLKREAMMRLKNCQQFITDDKLIHVLGEDGRLSFRDMSPLDIQGEYVVEIEALGESDQRQERRAEATQFLQTLAQVAPLAAVSGHPLDIHEIVGWYAKRWGITDWERFFSAQPAAAGAGAMGPGGGGGTQPGGPGQPPLQGDPNMGVTSATAVDASSPSATGGMSFSPEMFAQRAAALSSGRGGRA